MKAPAEFSRPIAIEGITPDKTRQEKVEATAQECAALCKRFDLRGLENFKATIYIRRVEGGEVVHVSGKLKADVIQTCVVSLQDVHAHVENEFETFFSENAPEDDEIVDGNEDAPELLRNGMLDLGEVAAQYLSLGLDPYPRAPGVSLAAQLQELGGEVRNSPFAVLQGLKKEEKKPAAKKKSEGVKKAVKAKPAKSGKKKKGE
ncbi:MAG: DUF177 domain-containing protein [Alphaproteobacteria bacterium]